MLRLVPFVWWLGTGAPPEPGPSIPAIDVTWQAPPGCPSRDEVTRQLARHLATSERTATVRVDGRVVARADTFALTLSVEVDGAAELRELDARDCGLVTRAGVLVVAVTVDALATANHLDTGAALPEPPSSVSTPAVQTAPLVGVSPPTDDPAASLDLGLEQDESLAPASAADDPRGRSPRSISPPRSASVALAAGGGLGLGLVPSVTGGVEGGVAGTVGRFGAELVGYHWFARAREVESEAGISAALSGARLAACGLWRGRVVDVPLCGALDVAASHGRGRGARVQALDTADLWLAAGTGVGVWWWVVPRFALTARADALVALRRPGMFLTIAGEPIEAFRVPGAAFRLVIGGRVRVWMRETRRGGAQ